MELMKGLDKEIEMPLPTTSGYNPSNRDSSSPTLASTAGETSSDQPPQTSDQYHLHQPVPSLPSNPLQQSERNARDPDPPSVTAITPIAGRSNPRPATAKSIRYRECLKNHAASMGGYVMDGCGEFMPSGEEGTPQSLRCAACDCHRNFHRKETEAEPQTNVLNYYTYPPSKSNNAQSRILSPQFPPHPPSLHHHHQQHMRFSGGSFPPLMMAFGGGGAAESSSEDLNMFQCNDAGGQGSLQAAASSRKRLRTKFSQEQKDRMMEFAEKLGWRIQKHDEQELQQFCNQVCVKRQVFKVWMHNNKQALKKKQIIYIILFYSACNLLFHVMWISMLFEKKLQSGI